MCWIIRFHTQSMISMGVRESAHRQSLESSKNVVSFSHIHSQKYLKRFESIIQEVFIGSSCDEAVCKHEFIFTRDVFPYRTVCLHSSDKAAFLEGPDRIISGFNFPGHHSKFSCALAKRKQCTFWQHPPARSL